MKKEGIPLAYKELIGDFNKIRDYMREFFVYGFKHRGEVGNKSSRTYDDKRRQLESWLGDYMSFTQSSEGKNHFISVDSREVVHNPLYEAFKASTFSSYDILLHFCLLDFMTEEEEFSIGEIVETLQSDYFDRMGNGLVLEERTVRNKLNSYVELGLLSQTTGKRKQKFYSLAKNDVKLGSWYDAISFFSEISPLGVIGSYLLDKKEFCGKSSYFWFKHHYMLYAMDSEILEILLEAVSEKRYVEISTLGKKNGRSGMEIYPVKIYSSTQNGREYLVGYEVSNGEFCILRLDNIKTAKPLEVCKNFQEYEADYENKKPYLWGIAMSRKKEIEHVEMTIRIGKYEKYILARLEREKRNGFIEQIDEELYKYVVDTCDAMELMPWLRTFIGRIVKLESSNRYLKRKFQKDMETMYSMYLGGEGDAF